MHGRFMCNFIQDLFERIGNEAARRLPLLQEADAQLARGPDGRPPHPPRRARAKAGCRDFDASSSRQAEGTKAVTKFEAATSKE